mgnify:CR=1 FL=1
MTSICDPLASRAATAARDLRSLRLARFGDNMRVLEWMLKRVAGEVVLVDWRHPTQDIPLDGPTVHALVRGACGPWLTVSHVEPDVLVDGYEVTR